MNTEKPVWELKIDRLISAPRERVYKAWTDPEQMRQWFAPKPFELVVTKMDFRVGGRFEMAMKGPDGSRFPFTGTYRVIEPGKKLEWTGEFAEGPVDQMTTTVTFADEGGKTRVAAHQRFFVMTETIKHATAGAKQGWGMTMDQLTAYVEGK